MAIVAQHDSGFLGGKLRLESRNRAKKLGAKIRNVLDPLEQRLLLSSTLYVDVNDISSLHDGSSWANAYISLQQALSVAVSGDTIDVAQGTYTPTNDLVQNVTFQLADGVAIYGGFAGNNSNNPNSRDVKAHPTILSGFIGTSGGVSVDSYHVVIALSVGSTSILDGFTITGGSSIGSGDNSGGGLYVVGGSPTINNCIFEDNSAINGGAVYTSSSNASFTSCDFVANTAQNGGAIYNSLSNPSLTSCTFTRNSALTGGAVSDSGSSPTIMDCLFLGNSVTAQAGVHLSGEGGAIRNGSDPGINVTPSVPLIINSIFVGNSAPLGSGVYSQAGTTTVFNCTFTANVGDAAIHFTATGATFVLTNSVLWGDVGSEVVFAGTTATTSTDNDVYGGMSGAENVNIDPQFVHSPSAGPDGLWGTSDDDYGELALLATSSLINAGSNAAVLSNITTDLVGNPRVFGGEVDLGAYELQVIVPDRAPALMSPGVATTPGQVIATSTPQFQWQAVPGADQYGLYISQFQTNGTYKLVFDSTALGILIPGTATSFDLPAGILVDGGQYRWNMNSYDAAGWGTYSPRLYLSVSSLPTPAAPTDVRATAVDPNTVDLSWPTVADATFYRIYRSTSATGPWNELVYQNVGAQTDDQQLLGGITYYYRVQASGPGGDSALSDVIPVSTPLQSLPPTPTGLQITSSSTSGVNLTWDESLSSGNYVLQRSSDGVKFSTIATFNANQNSFADTTIAMSTPQATYQYRLFSEVGGVLSAATAAIDTTINAVINSVTATPQGLVNLTQSPFASIPQIWVLNSCQMAEENTADDTPIWTLETALPTDAAFWTKPTIIIAHGWNSNFSDPNNPYDTSEAQYINTFAEHFVEDYGPTSANIFAIDWSGNGSQFGSSPNLGVDPFTSATNGIAIGTILAQEFLQAGLQTSETMLVGHSNGAGLMAAFAIKALAMGNSPVEDLVALDAPTETAAYGKVLTAAEIGAAQHVDNYYMTVPQGGAGAAIHLSDVTNYWLYNTLGDIEGHHEIPKIWANLTIGDDENKPWDLSVNSLITQTDSVASFDAASLWTQCSDGDFTLTLTYDQSALLQANDSLTVAQALNYGTQQVLAYGPVLLQGVNTTLQQTAGDALSWIVAQAHSPVQGSMDVDFPASAMMIGFDLTVTNPGNDDTLLVAVGNNVVGQVDLASQQLSGGHIEIPISDYAGQAVTLNFYMPSGVPSTAQFTIGNLSFETHIPGDTNGDGRVDIGDLTAVANHWQQEVPSYSEGDIDGNGFVDIQDLTAVANHWQVGVGVGQGAGGSENAIVPAASTSTIVAASARQVSPPVSVTNRGAMTDSDLDLWMRAHQANRHWVIKVLPMKDLLVGLGRL